MLAGLFDEEGAEFESGGNVSDDQHVCGVPRPPYPRNSTGLCGLSNLGATCYLNALLQTLHFTPEFRDALFSLGSEELGELSDDPNADNSMVRLIPLQLQRLFSRLLLVDQQSASVDALTSSFGWQSNEELQQHDVQELNRILFTAIESSLAGTSGEQLIARLYHGTSVSRVICQKCGRVSRREEEFLDLPVALSGGGSLENRLKESFVDMELLEGRNQYRCEGCKALVDAKKGTRLDKLPPILTFALLRFLYDFDKGERYKDCSKLTFPHQLDMRPYCDWQGEGKGEGEGESLVYELFSVVVHSGSTYSGHYTALIRDVDNLGNWTHPEEEPVKLPADPEGGREEFISFDSPIGLLKELLTQHGGSATIDKLTQSLQHQTGVTWNNRYKKQHGTLGKFLKKHKDVFEVSDTYRISLKTELPEREEEGHMEKMQVAGEVVAMATGEAHASEDGGDSHKINGKGEGHEEPTPKMAEDEVLQEVVAMDHLTSVRQEGRKTPPKALPPIGQRWFEYNDTSVQPIDSKEIDKMFQGKKSAYMLFYRRKTLDRPAGAMGNPSHGVSPQLLAAAGKENARLEEERERYDVAINAITISAHFSEEYTVKDGALQRLPVDGLELSVVEIDRRKTLSELKRRIQEVYPSPLLTEESRTLSLAKHLPAGLHIGQELKDDTDSVNLTTLGLRNGCNVFVWDGVQVGGVKPSTGPGSEPILLTIYYPSEGEEDHREICKGFPCKLTLQEFKVRLSGEVGIPPGNMSVSLINEGVQRSPAISLLGSSKNLFTLAELNLRDGDRLAVEKQAKKGTKMLAHTVADWQKRTIHIIVEDRCSPLPTSADPWPIITVETEKDQTLSHVKDVILKRINMHAAAIDGGGRLRIDDEFQGLGPPLHEDHTLATVGVVQGSKMVLEAGLPPSSSEISLQFQEYPPKPQDKLIELIVDKKTTIRQCLDQLIIALGLESDAFHLRKSNWCGEAADVIEDEEVTVEEQRLQPGDLLFIEEGKLPPKGFVRLPVFLYNPEEEGEEGVGHSLSGNADHAAREKIGEAETDSILQGLPLHEHNPAQYYPPVFGVLREIGSVEISKDATVEALKEMILTLPAMGQFVVPCTSFLRVRELANGRPGKVLKSAAQTLRRHKITSSSQVCCTCLHREENLGASSFVLNVHLRVEEQRTYGPPMEVVFDAHPSPTPGVLREHISHLLGIPLERLRVAKYKYEAFDWIKIADPPTGGEEGGVVSGKGSKKGKKGSKIVSLKNAPFLLKDGDIIGVKDVLLDVEDKDDFSIVEDDQGRAILEAVIEEKRRRRKTKGGDSWSWSSDGKMAKRRPEVGIKIYVPNFKK